MVGGVGNDETLGLGLGGAVSSSVGLAKALSSYCADSEELRCLKSTTTILISIVWNQT